MDDEKDLMHYLADNSNPPTERLAAARALGHASSANYEVWRALCHVFQDAREEAEVRMAAARALAQFNPAAAPNQLCRYLEGDEDRRVRAAAVAALTELGSVPDAKEPRLLRDLEALQRSTEERVVLNLALGYGRDPRVVNALTQALHHSDPAIRDAAQYGLGMLGEMAAVLQALCDGAPRVRVSAAETLGRYGLKTTEEIAALEVALQDPDPGVRRAAKTALRRLGVIPAPKPRARASVTRQAVARRRTASTEPSYDWEPLLGRWSRQWLRVREYAVELPDEVVEADWLGYPGATEQQLQELERRLGRTLPRSYRTFLEVTNGWRRTSPFIERVCSTAEVDYFRVRNQEWIDILVDTAGDGSVSPEEHARYGDEQNCGSFRAEYLHEAVQISEVGDAAVYLLNPAVVSPEGEWEAWFLASWAAGATRYRSFWDLMRAEYASFLRLEKPAG